MNHHEPQRREQERSQRILACLPQGFLYMHADFRVLQINDEGLRIDGRRA
ncbi:hypothetical protein [Massilia aquatica]|nr:hypothetical protein [Massilia aquatica]